MGCLRGAYFPKKPICRLADDRNKEPIRENWHECCKKDFQQQYLQCTVQPPPRSMHKKFLRDKSFLVHPGGRQKVRYIYAGLEVVFPGSKDFSWLRLRRPFPPLPPLFRSLPSAQCEGINTKPPPLPSLFGGGGNPGEERSRSCWWKEGGRKGIYGKEREANNNSFRLNLKKKNLSCRFLFFPGGIGGSEKDFIIKTKLSFDFSIFKKIFFSSWLNLLVFFGSSLSFLQL